MENLGYYNGTFGPIEEMTIPMNDRVCWFGDGVYDAGPARNYQIFALDDHLDRFYNSARLAGIEIPMPREELADLLRDLVKKVDAPEHFVYYQCTRGTAPRKHDYVEGPGNLWVTITPQTMPDGTKRIKLRSEPDTRFYHCNVKTYPSDLGFRVFISQFIPSGLVFRHTRLRSPRPAARSTGADNAAPSRPAACVP